MTDRAARRARILKIRTVERRMAEIELARSSRELQYIAGLEHRIVALRAAACGAPGIHQGTALRAMCEMTGRLDVAYVATAATLATAKTQNIRKTNSFVSAKQRETGAEKLAHAARDEAALVRERRDNACRVLRTTNNHEGEAL
jgi:hypothetical protein